MHLLNSFCVGGWIEEEGMFLGRVLVYWILWSALVWSSLASIFATRVLTFVFPLFWFMYDDLVLFWVSISERGEVALIDIGGRERFLFLIRVPKRFLEVLHVVSSNGLLIEKEKFLGLSELYLDIVGGFSLGSSSTLNFPNILSEAEPFGIDLCLGLVLKAAVVS